MQRLRVLLIVGIFGASGLYAYGFNPSSLIPAKNQTSTAPNSIGVPGAPTPVWVPIERKKRIQREIPDSLELEDDSDLEAAIRADDGERNSRMSAPTPRTITTRQRGTGIEILIPERPQLNTSSQNNPMVEVLRETQGQQQADNSERIFGGRVQRGASAVGGGAAGGGTTSTDSTDDPTEDEVIRRTRVGGQARGYTMLYLMQPEARATVEAQIGNMLRAEIQDLYLGVLVDGTFGENFPYLSEVLRRLTVGGRAVSLVLYLSNGATMRDFESTTIDAGFNKIDPNRFRNQILRDRFLQARFTAMVQKTIAVLDYNTGLSPSNRNYVSVMLEDNLDQASYRAMRELAATTLQGRARLVRSPCVGCCLFCRPPSDESTFGDGIEYHRPDDLTKRIAITGFTLDGVGYAFDGETTLGVGLEDVINLMAGSQALGAEYFGLWRAPRQGIYGGENINPTLRTYEVPNPEQLRIERELLRTGLSPVVTPTPTS